MADYKKYSELEKTYEYDKTKATVLAEALTEALELKMRLDELQRLIKLNNNLKKFIWGTAGGKAVAFHDLEDDHLRNILTYLPAHGREIPDALKAEARSRGFTIPDESTPMRLVAGKKFNGVEVYEEDDDYDDDGDRWPEDV